MTLDLFGNRAPLRVDGWTGSADFSDCGTYRWWLNRAWDDGDGRATFVMLNPSTADEQTNDPTVRRVCGFVRAWGFASVTVVNLFALRSTDPRRLYTHPAPEGDPRNLRAIREIAADAQLVVCAWGSHGKCRDRSAWVLRELQRAGVVPHALSKTKSGEPGHPLYASADLKPFALV